MARRSIWGQVRVATCVVADSALWSWWQAKAVLPRTAPRRWCAGDGATVVLVPGLATNWQFLRPVGDALSRAGFRVRVFPQLRRMGRSENELANMLRRFLESHREWGPVALVTHSKGGLVAKRVMLDDPDGRLVAGAVTIAAPFHGAVAARFVRGEFRSLRHVTDLRPGTPSVLELARRTEVNSRIVTISPIVDEIVGRRGPLPGARNFAVSAIGHNRLLALPRVQQLVVRETHRLMQRAP